MGAGPRAADQRRDAAAGVGAADRDRRDEYFTRVRKLDGRLVVAERWERTPKPTVEEPEPQDEKDNAGLREKTRLMHRMVRAGRHGGAVRFAPGLSSHLDDASRQDNTNRPVILAGGGFRHGRGLSFDREKNARMANPFVGLLQHVGVEADRSSTGTLTGLDA